MPKVPSLVEEAGRTACGILLLHHPGSEAVFASTAYGGKLPDNSNSPAVAENIILDKPVQFLSQIRHFVPSSLFAKHIIATDLRIYAAQCATQRLKPSEVFSQWIEMCFLSSLRVETLIDKKKEKASELEKMKQEKERQRIVQRKEKEKKRKDKELEKILKRAEQIQQGGLEGEKVEENEQEDEDDYDEQEQQEDDENEQLAQVTAATASLFVMNAKTPLDAARCLFGALYSFVLQLSTSVFAAMNRATHERRMQNLVDSNIASRQQEKKNLQRKQSQQQLQQQRSQEEEEEQQIYEARKKKESRLPPLVHLNQQLNSASTHNNSHHYNHSSSSSSSSHVVEKHSMFELDHSKQRTVGTVRVEPRPIHSCTVHSVHDNIAALKSDDLRAHVPLFTAKDESSDSNAVWELASLDFSEREFPILASQALSCVDLPPPREEGDDDDDFEDQEDKIADLQMSASTSKSNNNALNSLKRQVNIGSIQREAARTKAQRRPPQLDKELAKMSERVKFFIKECFLFSPDFLAPALTQTLVVLRNWWRPDTTRHGTSASAAQQVVGSQVASSVNCALLGVEPRPPAPYSVKIDGKSIFIPHPLPSHRILVSCSLKKQAQERCEAKKHKLKQQRLKNEKLLELQRRSMRPQEKLGPPPHVPGRSRREELGFGGKHASGDSDEALEAILKSRFSSATTSVLKKKIM